MPLLDVSDRRQLNERITHLFQQGRYQDALPLALDACGPANVGDAPAADVDRAESLEHLGNLYRELGSYPQAEPPLLQALSIRTALVGKEHPTYARTLNDLALLYVELAQYTQAEPLFRKALCRFASRPWAKTTPRWPRAPPTWRACWTCWPATARRTCCTARRGRSARRGWAKSIPTTPRA